MVTNKKEGGWTALLLTFVSVFASRKFITGLIKGGRHSVVQSSSNHDQNMTNGV